MTSPLGPEDFCRVANVSRETLEPLKLYADLLTKWQARINLVGQKTLTDVWRRHFLDSAQLWRLIGPASASVIDLGSGAGFPGLVLAMLGAPRVADVALIESDARKCAFLNEVIRQTGAPARVINRRIETVSLAPAPYVTARACAALPKLLSYAQPLMQEDGTALFLKGARVDEELTEARKEWTMQTVRHTSLSDPSGTILELRDIRRVIG